tara:strand:+ start:174 stop:392 length:219 start_codon:yes stop_codon:yes gene_type:complete
MEWLIIEGKTLKGKNKIKEAGTNKWVVIDEAETVQFSSKKNWIHILPDAKPKKLSRWIQRKNDVNFIIKETV